MSDPNTERGVFVQSVRDFNRDLKKRLSAVTKAHESLRQPDTAYGRDLARLRDFYAAVLERAEELRATP